MLLVTWLNSVVPEISSIEASVTLPTPTTKTWVPSAFSLFVNLMGLTISGVCVVVPSSQ